MERTKLQQIKLQIDDIRDHLKLIDAIIESKPSPITRSPVRLEGSPKSCFNEGCGHNYECTCVFYPDVRDCRKRKTSVN